MTDIDSYILIGGRSSRLGRDKAFVELNGRNLLQHSVEIVREALPKSRITAVAGSESQFAIQAASAGIPFVFDLYEDRGPVGGIHAALADARAPWIFVLACDYPFVTPELIRLLVATISDDFGAVVPKQKDGRIQPLCGFYNVRKALSAVERTLTRPRPSPAVRDIVAELDPRVVAFDEYAHLPDADHSFWNINTNEDLKAARERVGEADDP